MAEPDEQVVAALRSQLEERRRLLRAGAERVGWKIALGIGEVEPRIGEQPVIGYLTSATQLTSGARHSARGAGELCVDAELAVEIGRDGAIAGYAAALELVDLAQARGSLEAVVHANVLHRAFVLGPSHAEPAEAAAVYVDGGLRTHGSVDFDVQERVAAVGYWLSAVGERLEPGDRIITGSVVQVPVGRGDDIVADFGELGRVQLFIA